MKKSFITKAAVVLVVMSMLTVLLTGCSKTAVTSEDFKTLANSKGWLVEDVSSQFEAYDYIKEATITAPQTMEYQIEFYVLSDSAYAASFFANNKSTFEMSKTGNYTDSSASGKNYEVFSLNVDGQYKFIERVDNTVVYVDTAAENKEAIQAFLKELKY